MRNHLSSLLLALLMLCAAAPARADAGGGDAPDHPSAAMLLEPGAHEGALGGSDRADFYRVAHPAGMGVEATLVARTPESLVLSMRTSEGGSWSSGFPDNGTLTMTLRGASGSGEVVVGIEGARLSSASVTYTLAVAVVALPDFVVEEVEVRALDDPGEGVFAGTRREVAVTIANVGTAAGDAWLSVRAQTTTDGRTRSIAGDVISLAPGQTVTRRYEWDGTGSLGKVRFSAEAWSWEDPIRSNDVNGTEGWVGVRGVGAGISAFGWFFACAPAIYGGSCAYGTLEKDEQFAGLSAFTVAGGAYVHAEARDLARVHAASCAYAQGNYVCRTILA